MALYPNFFTSVCTSMLETTCTKRRFWWVYSLRERWTRYRNICTICSPRKSHNRTKCTAQGSVQWSLLVPSLLVQSLLTNTMASFSHPTSHSSRSHFITCSRQFLPVCRFLTSIIVTKYGAPDPWLSLFQWFRKKTIKLCIQMNETMGTESICNTWCSPFKLLAVSNKLHCNDCILG